MSPSSAIAEVFSTQLHRHHTHEDKFLRPRLRTRLEGREDSLAVLEAMEGEHARVAAAVERIETFISSPAPYPVALDP
jgi:hemerythrin-like domain-containing protein